jgi:general secretion pathway protein M
MTASRELRRLAALCVLAGLAGLCVAVAVPVVGAYGGQQRRIAAAEETLARYRGLAAQRPALERRLAEVRRREEGRNAYLKGGDKAIAGAALQTTIRDIVRAHGGEVSSTQTLPGETLEGFRRVAVESRLAASIESLQAILHAVETAKPHLFVDDLTVRVRPAPRFANAGTEPRQLDVGLTVSGFMETQVASAGEAK